MYQDYKNNVTKINSHYYMCCYYIDLQLLHKSSNFRSLKIKDQLVASHYIPSCGNICLYCIVLQHGCLLSNPLIGHAHFNPKVI